MSYPDFPETRIVDEANSPDNIRWSHSNTTACGLHAYLRPCQSCNIPAADSAAYPMHEICSSRNEQVIVCDDDTAFREEVIEMIGSFGVPAVGCGSVSALQAILLQVTSGCILLDIRMPGQDGLSAHDWIRKSAPQLPVIFISALNDPELIVSLMKGKAFDYFVKPVRELRIRQCVSAAIAESRKRRCLDASRADVGGLCAQLTPAERHVAGLISRGYPTKLIAAEMGRSENTVKIHRHRIMAKLRVNSAASVANIFRHLAEVPF